MRDFILANAALLLVLYLALSFVVFLLYGADKSKARRGKRRISEFCLLAFAFCFGALGAIAGMLVFRHKTKHAKFVVLVPLFLVLQTAALALALIL